MLKLANITKDYKVADTKVHALKGISVCFRENEFVSILGPSGCGKTTLLNIIGGLDHYTSGDLTIYGRSTKEFKDRDWDVYRNHRIGFIFQSYNLIPHQTVLGNVELALTIAGLSKAERVEKAKAALDKVGLSDQYYKRPNQLSGGQCQRVAIARSLVNDPEILLADEPTGALDTVTSGQIMDLVREIAKERLVIMVTHNPELAEECSTRIIRLLDGLIVSDTNPFAEGEEKKASEAALAKKARQGEAAALALAAAGGKDVQKKEKAKMSFFTAFKLSLQNLFSKKRRTIMVSVAGSIGIIGVSLVLSVSFGVQSFINNMQNDMLSGNPITVSEQALDLSALMQSTDNGDAKDIVWKDGKINVDATIARLVKRSENTTNLMQENEITQDYIDFVLDYQKNNPEYLAAVMLDYGLDLSNNIFTDFIPAKTAAESAAPTNVSLSAIKAVYSSVLEQTEYAQYSTYISSLSNPFQELPKNEKYITDQYNLTGKYATEEDEVMVVVRRENHKNEGDKQAQDYQVMSDLMLAQMGFFSQNEFLNMVFKATQTLEKPSPHYNVNLERPYLEIDEILDNDNEARFTYYPNQTVFQKHTRNSLPDPDNKYEDAITYDYLAYSDAAGFDKSSGIPLKVVGILEPKEGISYGTLSSGFFYTAALREKIFEIEETQTSDIVKTLTAAQGNASEGVSANSVKSKVSTVFKEDGIRTRLENIVFKYKYTYPYAQEYTVNVTPNTGNSTLIDLYRIMNDAQLVADLLADTDFQTFAMYAFALFPDVSSPNQITHFTQLSEQKFPIRNGNKTESLAARELKKGDVIYLVYENDDITDSSGNPVKLKFSYTVTTISKGAIHSISAEQYAPAGSPNQMAAMVGMFESLLPAGMGAGLAAAFGGNTLSLRELSGRNGEGETVANYIAIYPYDFKTKEFVLARLDLWNDEEAEVTFVRPDGEAVTLSADKRNKIMYQDILSIIISMINTMINIITIALIAFTSLALVVSTVMIGIITYVSVVERVKEIGVIRSLGGRKRDVSNLFIAETFIIGFVSGLIGIIVTYLLSAVINLIVGSLAGIAAIAVFPWYYAAIMVGVSVLLTLISGLMPASSAAKKDPVVALRTE